MRMLIFAIIFIAGCASTREYIRASWQRHGPCIPACERWRHDSVVWNNGDGTATCWSPLTLEDEPSRNGVGWDNRKTTMIVACGEEQ